MGITSSSYSYEKNLLADKNQKWSYTVPNSAEPGFSHVFRHPDMKDGLSIGSDGADNTRIETLWECFLRGREIAGPEGEFLGTRLLKVEDREDPHTDKSRLPKNYKPSGYVENADGSVKRFEYIWDSYQVVHDTAMAIGRGLIDLGCSPKDNIAIFSSNRAEWTSTHLGLYTQNMRAVALYSTLGADSIEHIVNQATTPVIFVSKENLAMLIKALPGLTKAVKHIVLFDCVQDGKYGNTLDKVNDADVEACAAQNVSLVGLSSLIAKGLASDVAPSLPAGDDLAFIMYTSGTSGAPKGVLLSHLNVTSVLGCIKYIIAGYPHVYFSYLPLAHIFETVVQGYVWVQGGRVGFSSGDIRRLVEDLQALQPTLLPGVPRVFLKFYQNLWAQVAKRSWILRWFINRAYTVQCNKLRAHQPVDEYYDSRVFAAMREKMGLSKIRVCVTGGAPCPPYLVEFMRALTAKPFVQGYGMTECAAACAVEAPENLSVGSVGGPMACVEMRLKDLPEMGYTSKSDPPTGELLLSGASIFRGYLDNPEATEQSLSKDSTGRTWLCTGDVARLNPNGSVSLIDRAKQLLKLSQGEYVAVEKVEDLYGRAPEMAQIWCYGNAYKPFMVAVAVPNPVPLYSLAVEKGWWRSSVSAPVPGALDEAVRAELARINRDHAKEVKAWVWAALKRHEDGLQGFEKIKAVTVEAEYDALGQGFDEERGTLTPTMKKRRKPLTDRYLNDLKQMYLDLGEQDHDGEKW